MKIALAGNPNSGKTTLFNALTGSNQHVGNWPGVTVEKKEGKIRGMKDVTIVDLPGIYSLSPYSAEEIVSRNFLTQEHPDVIINIADATNLERNLYLSTQLMEIGIPTIIALNMMDIIDKKNISLNIPRLEQELGCPIIPCSAATGKGVDDVVKATLEAATKRVVPKILSFSREVEQGITDVELLLPPVTAHKRWAAVKYLEGDEEILKHTTLDATALNTIAAIRLSCEDALDDDMQSIITNERYQQIQNIAEKTIKKAAYKQSMTDKIDRIVTNKWLALPIFFLILWGVYYVAISTVGDWTIGYVETFFGWIQGGVETGLESLGASEWLIDLFSNGLIGSIGAIFTFVPQIMILFLFLSLLEDSGYMARVAFIMDRIFRKFGLSGKSFIPMLIGTGCSVPGIMASRTIERENDRRMTIFLTPFIPCGAKLPVFAMIIALVFPHASWVGPSIYLIGIAGVIIAGLILKRTRWFAGDPAPFVMELPDYKLPRLKGVAIHMWEKGKSFIVKAGTIIFVACAALWFLQSFNFSFTYLGPEGIESSMLAAIGRVLRPIFVPLGFGDSWAPAMASITGLIAKEVVVATFASVGAAVPILFSQVSAFSFIIFTIFAAPCFAAIGAMKRELGSAKWTLGAVAFQTGTAYVLAMLTNFFGNLIFKNTDAVVKKPLDFTLMEAASEGDVVGGSIILYFFAALLLIALATMIINKIKSGKRGKLQENQVS